MDKVLVKEKLKNLTVLFVDDEAVIIEIMKNILPFIFKETFFASDGNQAIELYEKHQTDVIITDLSMPKLDGLSMLKIIKKINENVQCIFISGHTESSSINECKNLNCTYIVKPISSKILFDAFEKIV